MGGGGFGVSSSEGTMEMGSSESWGDAADLDVFWSSVSVSEPEDTSSQLSATGLLLGFCAGFCGAVVEIWRCESVLAISV